MFVGTHNLLMELNASKHAVFNIKPDEVGLSGSDMLFNSSATINTLQQENVLPCTA
jgi:hypothetical protein